MATDAYKYSMAHAGFPLRRETFYFSFRKKAAYIPFDLEKVVQDMLSEVRDDEVLPPVYRPSAAMRIAMGGEVEVHAAPVGSVVYPREPILSVTGPSFLVSYLEPRILMLQYQLQLATALRFGEIEPNSEAIATCFDHEKVIEKVCKAVGVPLKVVLRQNEYTESVYQAAMRLSEVVSLDRTFEVGLRAATCEQEHNIALLALKEAGVNSTSSTSHGIPDGMKVVGTMGHEHIQRFGDDKTAFEAMLGRFAGTPSFLLDTFDTAGSGIPAAMEVTRDQDLVYSVRYDSGDILGQFAYAEGAFKNHLYRPIHIIEDGLRPDTVKRFEDMRKLLDVSEARVQYGFGGYFISHHWKHNNPFTRDAAAAVYKLSETGGQPRMKFGNEAGIGKQSVPGRPVVWRRIRGGGPIGIIGQADETVPEGYCVLSEANREALQITKALVPKDAEPGYHLSPETLRLQAQIRKER